MVTRELRALMTLAWHVLWFSPHTKEKDPQRKSIILFSRALFFPCLLVPAGNGLIHVSGASMVVDSVSPRRQEPVCSPRCCHPWGRGTRWAIGGARLMCVE